jgi:iron complex outermembrane receptor protein
MRSIIILVLFILLIPVTIYAQDSTSTSTPATSSAPLPRQGRAVRSSVSGKITDAKTGQPLIGASVYFPDLKLGGTTNGDGNYKLQNVPAGTYLLEVTHLGFASALETVNARGDVQKNFSLKPSYVETEAVTVTGVSAATSVKRTPVPVSVVKKEDLLREASSNLIDALSKQAGVSQIATGPAISKPIIRGLGYNRVVVVNDGIRQEGQQWGDEHGVEIDEYNVNKAEILKGPASLMYGSDALAGVVNFISIVPVTQNTIKGNLFGTYQTNNMQRGFHGDIGCNQNGFIWGLYGSYKGAADYKNKYDGYVFNSKFNERDFGGHIGFNKEWGYSHFIINNFDQRVGLVEGARDSITGQFVKAVNNNGVEDVVIATDKDFRSINPFVPNQRVRHFKVATDNSFNVGRDRLTAVFGYQRNQRQEFGNILAPSQSGLYFDLKTFNYNVQYHLADKNNWRTTIGVNGMDQNNTNRGSDALIPEYSLFDIGAFVYTQKRINNLTLSGGARYDNRSTNTKQFVEAGTVKFAPFKKNYSNVSFSAGLSYEASKNVTLKFNVARGFRAPSIPELASNGAHEGTNRFEYGEQDLTSETSVQLDGGLEIATEHVTFSANLFYNAIKDFIYYRKLSSRSGGDSIIRDNGEDFFAFKFDHNNAKLYGAEANLDIHPHPWDWFHIENTFSYVRGQLNEAQDGSKNLPFIPAARLINEIKADVLKTGKILRNAYIKLELDNTFNQSKAFTGYNTETPTPGYSLLNMGFGGDIAKKGKPLFSLFFSANNLTDVAYQNHLSRLKYADVNNATGRQGVYNMGRNFSVKLNVPFSFTTK